MIRILDIPDRLHKAFNDCFVAFGLDPESIKMFGRYYSIVVNSLIEIGLSGGTRKVELERAIRATGVHFNLKSVLSNWFTYRLRLPIPSRTDGVIWDFGLFREYSIEYQQVTQDEFGEDISVPIIINDRFAFNGATNYIDGDISMMKYQGQVLMKDRYIRKYEGYPLLLAFLNFPTRQAWIYKDGFPTTPEDDPITEQHFCIPIGKNESLGNINVANFYAPYLSGASGTFVVMRYPINDSIDGSSTIWLTDDGSKQIIFDRTVYGYDKQGIVVDSNTCGVDDLNESQHYVWLRWINDIAGYEYAMFAYRHVEMLELSSATNFTRSNTTQNFVTEYEQAIEKKLVRSITVGMEGVSDSEIERVQGILKSPLIEMYSEARFQSEGGIDGLDGWVPVTANKCEVKRDSRETMQKFEIKLDLPPEQKQFV